VITTAAHEAPLLMRPHLVRETLEGRKTQTRRIVDLDSLKVRLRHEVRSDWPMVAPGLVAPAGVYRAHMNQHGAVSVILDGGMLGVKPGEFDFVCPYAAGRTHLGDYGDGRKRWTLEPEASRLWVREAHALVPVTAYRCSEGVQQIVNPADPDQAAIYRAGWERCTGGLRWRPSIHMPRWACRLELDVASVRLEHLQEITLGDCVAEGCPREEWYMVAGGALKWFRTSWDAINGQRASWSENPWVWAISFRRAQ